MYRYQQRCHSITIGITECRGLCDSIFRLHQLDTTESYLSRKLVINLISLSHAKPLATIDILFFINTGCEGELILISNNYLEIKAF
ncbi:hypothetical protein EB796_018729 [Bugula neritina]|uniref:Uncharacterized protein n=1 Tax=Bugula neritina TaxID=10212 RepID=A0A7J7JAF7_BUGNE|nr:hypothetical protein EB796_018729 [Bugula neritina]